MESDKLKLDNVKASIKPKVREYRASDFMTSEEKEALNKSNAKGAKIDRKFDDVDAYAGEILGRFGYDAYKAWQVGEIGTEKMNKLLLAERAREAQARFTVESIIVGAMAGANHPTKHKKAPESLKQAVSILKKEHEITQTGGVK